MGSTAMPPWRAMEMIEVPVAASTVEQKFKAQDSLAGKKIVALMWSSRITIGPGGVNVIGTTNVAAKTGCFIKLKRGTQDYINQLPLVVLDPDYRLGQPFYLPEPVVLDWNNSTFKFTNASHVTAGEVLVIYAFYL